MEAEGRNPHGIVSDLEIHVPAGSRVEISSFAANIVVTDVTGAVTADGVNSNIAVSGASKEVSAQTVNGTVDVSGASGRIHAESVNGGVTLKGVSGSVEANTVNGRLMVTGGGLRARPVGDGLGLAAIRGRRDQGGLRRSPDGERRRGPRAARVDLGRLLPHDLQRGHPERLRRARLGRTSKFTSEKELEFSTGNGNAKVEVQTLSGAIVIKKRI